MTAPSPYANMLRQMTSNSKAALPASVEDMHYIAAMIAAAIAVRETTTHCRVHFDRAGALEAAHKLAAWLLALPPSERAAIENWLTRPPSNGR